MSVVLSTGTGGCATNWRSREVARATRRLGQLALEDEEQKPRSARSRRLSYALARAERAGVPLEEIEPGRFRARFQLDEDPREHSLAWALVSEVRSLAGTEVDVDGGPESVWEASAMAYCARSWLRTWGTCGQSFPLGRPFPYCFLCPLLDPSRAGLPIAVPDHVPEEWG